MTSSDELEDLFYELDRFYKEHDKRKLGSFLLIYYIVGKYTQIIGENPKIDDVKKIAKDLMSEVDFEVSIEKFSYTKDVREFIEKEYCHPLYRPMEIYDGYVKVYKGFSFTSDFPNGWSNIPNIIEFLYPKISEYIINKINEEKVL